MKLNLLNLNSLFSLICSITFGYTTSNACGYWIFKIGFLPLLYLLGQVKLSRAFRISSASFFTPEPSSQWDMPSTPHQGAILLRCPSHLT